MYKGKGDENMSVKYKYYVYHDDNYALSWISDDGSKKISEWFAKREFEEIDTNSLVKIMNQGIRNPDIDFTIIFSHDVIPDKLLDSMPSPTPNSLFRKFLNVGHTIIWLGDVPTWYAGLPGKEKKPLSQPSSIQNLIGIDPPTRSDERVITVKPTLEGLLLGMKPWKGKRPHPPTSRPNFHITYLAASKEGIHSYICSPQPMQMTTSGLIRLYDFSPLTYKTLTDEMLTCILNVALKRNIWNELASLARKFETLRSEIDEKILKKLDLILEEIKRKNR